MKPYEKGRRAEWRVRSVLEEDGYVVVRSAASKGPIDLVAIHPEKREILLIQVKSGRSRLSREERERLASLAGTYTVKPIVAVRKGKYLQLEEVRG